MFSEPVVGEKFFGREEILELLNKRVLALKDGYRQNIAFTGQSLAGKSSIILHFLHTIKEDGFIPVYVEVVKESFRSFSNKFIATMLYNVLGKLGEDVDIDITMLLESAQRILPKTYLAIKNVNSLVDRENLDEAYSNLLGITSILKSETNLSCIVILDEFDNLERLGIKNPFLAFGKVIMVQKDTMYIVSSSRDAAIKKILSEKLALLFGNFEVVKVSNFDRKTSTSFIRTKLVDFDMDEALVKFLTAFSGGNPFYLDRLAAQARSIAIERMSSHIDADVIANAILDLVYNSSGVIHQYLMNLLLELIDTKQRETHLAILVAIASGRNTQSEITRTLRTGKGEVGKGISRLVESGLMSKNGTFYKIDDAMLGFWLKHVYQRRKEMLVNGTFDKTCIFTQDLKDHLDEFTRGLEKDVASKVAELFGRFSDELVQLEDKYIRLPHFTKVEVKTFADSRRFIAASFRNNFWIIQPYEYYLDEIDVITFMKNVKALGYKISNKIIMPLNGIDENARLLAKELKIPIWDDSVANLLLELYGGKKMVIL